MLTFEREAYRGHFDGGLLGDRFARMRAWGGGGGGGLGGV